MPSRDALSRLWQEIALSREDANPRLTLGEGELRRYDQHLWWVRVKEGQRQTVLHWSDRQTPLILPAGLGCLTTAEQGIKLRLPAADEQLSVRFTVPGKLYIVGRDRGRSLKKIWQECGIPPGGEKPRRFCFTTTSRFVRRECLSPDMRIRKICLMQTAGG